MSINIFLAQILILSILTVAGVLASKYNLIEEKAETTLANIVIYITIPSLILYSLSSDIELEKIIEGITIPFICMVLITLMMVIAFCIIKITNKSNSSGTIMILSSMPNSGFLGFPVVYTIFGQEGLTYAVLFDIGVTFIFFSLAIIVLKSDTKIKMKNIFNPPLMAFVFGLLLKIFQIDISGVLLDSLRIAGNSTIFLAMLLMGVNLIKVKPKKEFIQVKELLMISIIKLLVFPMLTFIILMTLNLNPIIKSVVLLESAMPSMVSTPILIEKYGGNMNLTVSAVFVTTVISLFTIPIILLYLV